MKKIRYVLFVVFLALVLLGCSSTSATTNEKETYTIIAAHSTAETTSFNEIFKYFKSEIEERSEGRIKVEIYPSAQLGADRELIEGVQLGDVTMSLHSTAPAVNVVDDVAVFDIPFLFPDKETARAAMHVDSPFFELLAQSQEEKGFKLLGLHDQGFRQLTTKSVKVESPNDLDGVRLRTMENPYHMATWQTLGANPTPLPFNEVYTALQQGTVDGQENPFELIISQRFYEQQDYLTETNHILQAIQIIMNQQYFDDLPEDLQILVEEVIAEAVVVGNEFIDDKEAEYKEIMTDAGVEFVEITPDQLATFQESVSNVLDQISQEVDEELLNTLLESVQQ